MSVPFDHLRDLFLAALDQPADQRDAFLDGACVGDDELRRNVARLLAAQSAGEGPLDRGAFRAQRTEACPPGVAFPGTVIAGRYQLLERIGEGGMGTVWMAQQTHPVQRRVALKLIRAGMGSPAVLARFEAERQALALMDHPHIARVFDAGTTETGQPYFVMELVQGIPLTAFCDLRRLTPRQRLGLFVPVCQAIQHAHQKGVIHRDLKPSNVLVALYDGVPVPKVIDFGVAKAIDQPLTERTLYTLFGTVVGTLEYMSPEQAGGNALDIDTRSDIYSLGVLLYELLTGSPPFERKDLEQAGLAEMLRVIREQEPTRPSTRLSTADGLPALAANRATEPKRLAALVRGELDWIVMKALEKDRSRRYETASGLAMDVQRYLDDEPVLACPPSAWYRLLKFARRNRVALTMAGLVGLTLLTAVTVLTIANVGINDALAAKSRAYDDLETAQKALSEEQHKTRLAYEGERQATYRHAINRGFREWLDCNVGGTLELLQECPPDLRNLEWNLVTSLCHQELLTLAGHKGSARCVAFSPDGRLLASGSTVGLTVWELPSGGERLTRSLGEDVFGAVNSLAFSPDGARIAVGHLGGAVRVIDHTENKVLWTSRLTPFSVTGISYSPDGSRVAVTDGKSRVRVLAASDGNDIAALSSSYPSQEKLSQALAPRLEGQTPTNPGRPEPGGLGWFHLSGRSGCAVSPDGRHFAARTPAWTEVRLADALTGTVRFTLRLPGVHALAFSPDGQLLATGSDDHSIRLWDVGTGRELAVLRGHADFVENVVFSPDGRLLASAGWRGSVKVWDVSALLQTQDLSCPRLDALTVSPDGGLIAVCVPPHIGLWDTATGKEVHRFPGVGQAGHHILFTPAGKHLVAIGYSERESGIWIGDVRARKEVRRLRGDLEPYALAVDASGARIAAAGKDCCLKVWDLGTGQERQRIATGSPVSAVIFSPDGQRVIGGGKNGTLQLFESATGRALGEHVVHQDAVRCLTFSPDGKLLVSGSRDGTIGIFDAAGGRVIETLKGHLQAVVSLAFSADGRRLVSASWDRTVKFWDVARWKETLTLGGLFAGVNGAALDPKGRWLAVGDRESVRLLPLAVPPPEARWARHRAVRLAWHHREANRHAAQRQPFAAAFHRARLNEVPPRDEGPP